MRFPRHAARPLPQSLTFVCAGCDAPQISTDRRIPVGWSILGARVLCDDCTTSAIKRAGRNARRTPRQASRA